MEQVSFDYSRQELKIMLSGHIDSSNAPQVEKEIQAAIEQNSPSSIVVDCSSLNYISSAGLRIILRTKKAVPETKLVNVSTEVYEIFDMTGFTEMMEIHKAYRTVDVEGCEVIGQGANGRVYRIDADTIVKIYFSPDALPEIQRERELARAAFVLGIPTAIPYDVVQITGGGYGSVYELLNAASLADLLKSRQMTLDEAAVISVDLLKQIHGTKIKPGSMPDMKAVALDWAAFLKDYLPEEHAAKLCALVEAVPDVDHMLHGDYHIKNVMIQNGESLLIDMDTLCHGHPVFELASMYNAYCGFGETDHAVAERFLGIPYDQACLFWKKSLELYLGTQDEQRLREVEQKAMVIGYARMMRRSIRRNGLNTEAGRREIDNCREHLLSLIPALNELTF